jgi:hypothetical protein
MIFKAQRKIDNEKQTHFNWIFKFPTCNTAIRIANTFCMSLSLTPKSCEKICIQNIYKNIGKMKKKIYVTKPPEQWRLFGVQSCRCRGRKHRRVEGTRTFPQHTAPQWGEGPCEGRKLVCIQKATEKMAREVHIWMSERLWSIQLQVFSNLNRINQSINQSNFIFYSFEKKKSLVQSKYHPFLYIYTKFAIFLHIVSFCIRLHLFASSILARFDRGLLPLQDWITIFFDHQNPISRAQTIVTKKRIKYTPNYAEISLITKSLISHRPSTAIRMGSENGKSSSCVTSAHRFNRTSRKRTSATGFVRAPLAARGNDCPFCWMISTENVGKFSFAKNDVKIPRTWNRKTYALLRWGDCEIGKWCGEGEVIAVQGVVEAVAMEVVGVLADEWPNCLTLGEDRGGAEALALRKVSRSSGQALYFFCILQ